MSKKSKEQVTTSSTSPPDFILDELEGATERAAELSTQPREFFPGNTVVPFSAETNQGFESLRNLIGQGPSGPLSTGNDTLLSILEGGGDAEDLAAASADAIGNFIPQTSGQFGLAGRSGSGLAADAAARGVTRIVADEQSRIRDRQLTALGLVPQFDQLNVGTDFRDAGILGTIGDAVENKQQEQVNEDVARHDFEQNEERVRLAELVSLLSGLGPLAGGTSTATAPGKQSSGLGSLLGIVGGIGGGIFGGPAGAKAGASIGSTLGGAI